MKTRTMFATLALAGLPTVLGGCLISSSNTSYETGQRVTEGTTSRITVGETTESWLLATLGEPTSRTAVEGQPGVEILRYDHTRREESGGALFLLFAGSTKKTTRSSAWFEVTDGIVTNYGLE